MRNTYYLDSRVGGTALVHVERQVCQILRIFEAMSYHHHDVEWDFKKKFIVILFVTLIMLFVTLNLRLLIDMTIPFSWLFVSFKYLFVTIR